jgi:hypothetical protein
MAAPGNLAMRAWVQVVKWSRSFLFFLLAGGE